MTPEIGAAFSLTGMPIPSFGTAHLGSEDRNTTDQREQGPGRGSPHSPPRTTLFRYVTEFSWGTPTWDPVPGKTGECHAE